MDDYLDSFMEMEDVFFCKGCGEVGFVFVLKLEFWLCLIYDRFLRRVKFLNWV